MTDAVWARHANPWSVWSRVATLPVLALAVWSRVWIGPWAWAAVAALAVWIWLNPRLFAPVAPSRRWDWRAVMGERLWTRRRTAPIPAHHAWWAALLTALQVPPALLTLWSLWALSPGGLAAGVAGVMLTKFWFLDRMVWLHDEVAERNGTPI